MSIDTQTDTKHVAELRAAADEAQAAWLEVVSEIARLTKALRAAEAERDENMRGMVRMRWAGVVGASIRIWGSGLIAFFVLGDTQ